MIPKRRTPRVAGVLATCLVLSLHLADAGTIPVTVRGDGPDAMYPAPVKFGVPFPEGAYRS